MFPWVCFETQIFFSRRYSDLCAGKLCLDWQVSQPITISSHSQCFVTSPHPRSIQALTLFYLELDYSDVTRHCECKPWLQMVPSWICVWCYRHRACAHNVRVASAVWDCTELEPPVKISPSSGCQYKGSRSKTFPSHASLCQISKNWSLCMKPSILLIWLTALEQSSKQSCDLRLLPHERGDQFCWQ